MPKSRFIGGAFSSKRLNCIPRAQVERVVTCLLETQAKRATVYLSPTAVISACRRFKPNKGAASVDILLKIGRPNFREREFIRACEKAGEPFPVKKLQLRWWKAK